MQNYLTKKAIIKKVHHNKVEVFKTHGDNLKIKKYLKIRKFKNITNELNKIIDAKKPSKFGKLLANFF